MKALLLPLAALAVFTAPLRAQPWSPRGGYPNDLRQDRPGEKAASAQATMEREGPPAQESRRPVPGGGRTPQATAWPNAIGQRFVFTANAASTVEINGVRYRIGAGGLTVDTDLAGVPDAVAALLSGGGQTPPFGARSVILVNETAPDAAAQEYALEISTFELAAHLRTLADGPEREAAARTLQQHLRALFDFKQAQRARELDALEHELDTLRRQHAARSRNREAIVRQRMRDLLAQ